MTPAIALRKFQGVSFELIKNLKLFFTGSLTGSEPEKLKICLPNKYELGQQISLIVHQPFKLIINTNCHQNQSSRKFEAFEKLLTKKKSFLVKH